MQNLYKELEYPQDLMGVQIQSLGLFILQSPECKILIEQVEKTISENLIGKNKIRDLETIWTSETLLASFKNTTPFNQNGNHTCPWEIAPKTIAILEINGVKLFLFDGRICLEWNMVIPDDLYGKFANRATEYPNLISHTNLLNLIEKICLICNQKLS